MKPNITIFNNSDFADFKEWVNLDLDAVTWQRKHEKEFEEFWALFFVDGLSLQQVLERFQYATTYAKIGPLISWFNWLKEKFIVYAFIYKNLSLYDLGYDTNIPISEVANILRLFFLTKFPHLDEYLNNAFQIGNILGENLHLTFEQFSKKIKLTKDFLGSHEDEVMPSMEVTLYADWNKFIQKMKKNFYHPHFNIDRIRKNTSLSKQLTFFRDLFLLLLAGILLIYGIRFVNLWYENYIADKISIYEPQFKWLDKTLRFKPTEEVTDKVAKIDLDELDTSSRPSEDLDIERDVQHSLEFITESEVMLTSWDSLPKNFDVTELEQSEYEESRKGDYRDTRFGNRTVYRVMLSSDNPNKSKNAVNELIGKYGITQVDNVKPGTLVPGGLYYNLYVPRQYLKEFLAQVVESDSGFLYESRTRGSNPPGVNKVFIWIKTL